LIDVVEPHQQYSLAEYIAAAHKCIEQIKARGREVIFVGGTPLYLKGLLRGIFNGPPADWELRQRLREKARLGGSAWLHRQLAEVDPQTAARLHPNDTRRLVRALEVYYKMGQSISQLQQQFNTGLEAEACRVFVLNWPRRQLHARIDSRVEHMFAAGLVDEVRELLARPQPLSRTTRKAVGYREVIEHLAGERGLPETIELVKCHTRQLGKRQQTWFRGLSECRFLPIHGPIDAAELAGQIAAIG
jgi:tRNA dimethylallyltransferase